MLSTEIGILAENQAINFLISQNIKILFKNFNALPYGEIDIIALDEDTLLFIEVKYRKKTFFGKAEEMLTLSKQKKIINSANIFLQKHIQYEDFECRFDVIAINNKNINWIKAAFDSY